MGIFDLHLIQLGEGHFEYHYYNLIFVLQFCGLTLNGGSWNDRVWNSLA